MSRNDRGSGREVWGGNHAYSRKYSRFARLRLLGFKTPYFRNVTAKKDTRSFFVVVIGQNYDLRCCDNPAVIIPCAS